ncbi:acetyltransferase [Balneicella halophila]|uniref:Acetyltransferase n=1 Tax=Balneicella halophila TaxID=1537566 RepID=A0A7L4UPP7_BALHA|nr:acetate--CoA ligase [Balneicella halophila]PVX51765.1 acetyltransferase [Balneicella halophila]
MKITKELIQPKSIVVIGASNDIEKPGGKALYNIKNGTFDGDLYAVNPKTPSIQEVDTFKNVEELPQVDLALLAIPAKFCTSTIEILVKEKNTKAIIVLSAGFSEMGEEGKKIERKMVELVEEAGASLIGPNCTGMMNVHHQSNFTTPVPKLTDEGCIFISSSGATAVFIMEIGLKMGLDFSSIFSVGNAAHISVEDVLEYIAETYEEHKARTILLYIESINDPQVFLKSAQFLVEKGFKIVAVKSGTSDAGSRAAASHTGAMLSSDMAVGALFKKAGVIRVYGRQELVTVGSVLQHPELKGKNIAIITHAGGPAVMLTDALSEGGLAVPHLPEAKTAHLLEQLFDGSSVSNPIDFLATGTASQLEKCIRVCEEDLSMIDGMVVIFGSPGLFANDEAYEVIREQQLKCKKPIYAVMPSVINCEREMAEFVNKGGAFFDEEVNLGRAMSKVFNRPKPSISNNIEVKNTSTIQSILKDKKGLLPVRDALKVLDLAGIKRPQERLVYDESQAEEAAKEIGFPLVMKVVGPAHKSEVGGVILGVNSMQEVKGNFAKLSAIPDADGVQISEMVSGVEIFIGVKKEPGFGHLITCGLGGIFVEVMKDIQTVLAPVTKKDALQMVRSLKSYPIIKGIRGKEGVDEDVIADTICKVSDLLQAAPQIEEMDINPLMGRGDHLVAVDIVITL